jgi:Protein of unknown function (DUF1761)
MQDVMMQMNWLAVVLGTVLAFGFAWIWFGPVFGKTWAAGTHGIRPPDRFPALAMAVHLLGIFVLACVVGATATTDALGTALLAILACAALQTGGALYSQKTMAAALVDGGSILGMGALMIAAQGIF